MTAPLQHEPEEIWDRAAQSSAGITVRFADRASALKYRATLYNVRRREQKLLAGRSTGWDHLTIRLRGPASLWIGPRAVGGIVEIEEEEEPGQ